MMAGILERPNSSSKSGESILTNLNILIINLGMKLLASYLLSPVLFSWVTMVSSACN